MINKFISEKGNKPRIFSGIQPSGHLTLGNYIGAISQWVNMQSNYDCIFSVVDYHAITVKQDPEELKERIKEVTKIYLAAGIDPDKVVIFQQSQVTEHTELAWILNCYGARMADLNKMTQFKDKAGNNQESVSVGLYDYPVLMAADILLYDTDVVPVGEDQKQHVELARTIARRFNQHFGNVFRIPEAVVKKDGARVMSLQDPFKKMSKSDANQKAFVGLLDDPDLAYKKIQRAVTDSGSEITYDPKTKPAIANLLQIYASLSGKKPSSIALDYKDKGYGQFKKDLGETVKTFLASFQDRYDKISDDDVKKVLESGRQRASAISRIKIDQVRKIIGVGW